ncbi:hypothetical protein QE369_000357 [Agrobacterium larrymoorei]|uniref:Uncharacterized protein n=1 Tax=Agrobacterium larrymoorei TaxID=160699 RepID=A0AAJ2EQ42_9HYPH|nr:hypothetical protein [Agrobacterium larrymoorei]
MKASKFSKAQIAFVWKQAEDESPSLHRSTLRTIYCGLKLLLHHNLSAHQAPKNLALGSKPNQIVDEIGYL